MDSPHRRRWGRRRDFKALLRWGCNQTSLPRDGSQAPVVQGALCRWGYHLCLKDFLLHFKVRYFRKLMNLFLLLKYEGTETDGRTLLPSTATCSSAAGVWYVPLFRGCCLWERRLGCERWIIKGNWRQRDQLCSL